VLHALQSNQATCKFLDLSGSTVHDEDLEARIVVEMRMTGRDHQFMTGMLEFRQLLCDTVNVMIEDEGNGADYRGIGTRRPFRDQAIANQVAKGFGPVCVAQTRDEMIKAFEEVRIECNSDSGKDAHGHSLEED
jgi:hypothetical protein